MQKDAPRPVAQKNAWPVVRDLATKFSPSQIAFNFRLLRDPEAALTEKIPNPDYNRKLWEGQRQKLINKRSRRERLFDDLTPVEQKAKRSVERKLKALDEQEKWKGVAPEERKEIKEFAEWYKEIYALTRKAVSEGEEKSGKVGGKPDDVSKRTKEAGEKPEKQNEPHRFWAKGDYHA